MASGAWLVIEELLERGDPAFVEALRACADAERLAAFAAVWYADRRPQARRYLREYLLRPLNAYHHEGLVKRLFKLAERAGDDEVMAHFLVCFDRALRRRRKRTYRFVHQTFASRTVAEAQERQWQADGAERTGVSGWALIYRAWARWPEEKIVFPRGTTMPRGKQLWQRNPRTGTQSTGPDLMRVLRLRGRPPRSLQDLPEEAQQKLAERRLFSVHTRHYLRRRAWRYFRNLARTAPERYVPAALVALKLYEDADVADGLALLDNWSLMHILFHDSPVLWPRGNGWTLRPGQALGALAPAPAFPELWRQAPAAILELLRAARCRPVRQWALFFLRQDPTLLDRADVEVLFELLQSSEPELVAFAARALAQRPGLEGMPAERWLGLLDRVHATALDAVCGLVQARVRPEALAPAQLMQLACSRPVPIARLGMRWLQERAPMEPALLLRLTEAEAETVRPELVRWARTLLGRAADFQASWVLDYLDSRHADVRAEGWAWLQEEPRARDDVQLWQRLFESPYDDVRLPLIAHLENRYAGRPPALPAHVPLDPERVRLLWATVLLNVRRGSRSKPPVVQQIARRLAERPEDAARLLPILRIALRSVRGPEWRAGLSGVVQLLARRPELEKTLHETFPELQLLGGAV